MTTGMMGLLGASGLARARTLIQWFLLWVLPLPPPILLPDDQYIIRYYAAIYRVMEPCLHRVFLLLRPASSLSDRDLLFALPGYSNTKYKEFSQPQRSTLDNGTPSTEYDVSLLYKLLLKLCGLNEARCSVAGTLENKLKTLKDHRNEFCHETVQLTSNDLQNRVTEIKDLCREILEEAGRRSGQTVTGYVKEMEDGMTEVLTGGVDLWEPYRQGLQHLRQEQCNVLIRESKKDVRRLAQKCRILNPFAWLLDRDFSYLTVQDVFTELNITDSNQPVAMSSLLSLTLPSGEVPDVLVISGSPGSGKTSLTRFLLNESIMSGASTVHGLDNFDLILPVETRNVSSTDVCSFVRDELLPSICSQLHHDDTLATLRDVAVFWLIDGYDEATDAVKKLIKELLQKCPDSKFLITTRPEFTREVELLLNNSHLSHLTLFNKGFSTSNMKVYTEKLFCVSVKDPGERKDSFDRFISYLDKLDYSTKLIFQVPLFLSMLVVLWLRDQAQVSTITTTTRLLNILVNNIVNKMVHREPFSQLQLSESKLRNNIEKVLHELGKLFWTSLGVISCTQNHYLIKKLEAHCDSLGLPFDEVTSPFFVVSEKATATGVVREYSIIHRTLQDFLRAKSFCHMMLDRDCDILTAASDLKEFIWEYTHQVFKSATHYSDFLGEGCFRMEKLCDDDETYYGDMPSTEQYEYDGFCPTDYFESDDREQARQHCRNFSAFSMGTSFIQSLICGYLSIMNAQTKPRAEQIVYMASISEDNPFLRSFWCELIKESEEDKILIKEISSYLSVFQWELSDYYEFEAACEMVKYVTPQLLFIHHSPDCKEETQALSKVINTFSHLPVEIFLDFRFDNYERRCIQCPGQECLDVVLQESSKCRLTGFIWPDSTPDLNLLKTASNLQELWVKVSTVKDLNQLAALTNHLENLQHLSVTVDATLSTTDPQKFPSLMNRKWEDTIKNKKACPPKMLPPLSSMPDYLTKFNISTEFDIEVMGLPQQLLTVPGSLYVDIFAEKLQLPLLPDCYTGCTMFMSDKSARDHLTAIKYHKLCIKRIGFIQTVMKTTVRFMTVTDKTTWKELDPCVKYLDSDGTWWCRVCIGVCAALIFQHRRSIQMHRRFFKCFCRSRLSSPIHLLFSEGQNLDPRWVGAAAARLCPYPKRVDIDIDMNQLTWKHKYSLMFWLYTSVAEVKEIGLTLFDSPVQGVPLNSISEYMIFTDRMNIMAPGVKYSVHFVTRDQIHKRS